jgi:hypothetical protein
MPAIVTFTTDFEEREPYVASAKGVLCARCPGVAIIDLTHQIPRQSVPEAALFLAGAVPYFPAGTVHVIAVASGTRPIAVSLGGQFFVCPDNGVLTLLSEQLPITDAREITNPLLNLSTGGQVYYARDVFAPAAAELAQNGKLSELGDRIDDVARLDLPRAERKNDTRITGQIIHVNRFGSLVTNIHRSLLDDAEVTKVIAGDFPIGPLSESYSDVPVGSPLALFGSSGYLEVAYNGDRAETKLNMRHGIVVAVDITPARS